MQHIDYMRKALKLAKKAQGLTSPNPMVGCVVVKDHHILAEGYHQKRGEAHAEVDALQKIGYQAQGATLYVTLEPCCHHGYTPPCVDALIQSGIKEVYIAAEDPNPLVRGKGIAQLRTAGITIHVGLLQTQAEKLNRIFAHYITSKTPYVIAKWAMSLDGKTTTHPNDSRLISNSRSHRASHALRQRVDAILVGANTARLDNPLLTVRHGKRKFKPPLRIILSRDGNLPLALNLFQQQTQAPTLLVTTDAISPAKHAEFCQNQIEVLIVAANAQQQVHLPSLMLKLAKREISSILVEGGMRIHESFFQENLVNEVQVYLAPIIIGQLTQKKILTNLVYKNLDNDLNIGCTS